MFDDGRFMQSLVQEARSAGLTPMRGRSGTGMPPALRKMSSSAVAREPEVKALDSGFEAGGGVRLHPPHLEEALGEAKDAFTSATPRPKLSWLRLTVHDAGRRPAPPRNVLRS